MGLLEPYRGNYIFAKSAESYIDIDSIVAGCQALADAGSNFYNISNKIYNVSENCGADALSIDGKTLVSLICEKADFVMSLNSNLSDLANSILSNAYDAYNRIQSQLNDDAYRQECNYVNQLNSRR